MFQYCYEKLVFRTDMKGSNRDFHGLLLGREKLKKETSILKIIQRQRYFAASLKKLLSSAERQRLKEKTQVWVLDLDQQQGSSDEDKDESFDDAYRGTVHQDVVARDSVHPQTPPREAGLNSAPTERVHFRAKVSDHSSASKF